MSEFREPLREPLHQPPNPADLRRVPPSSPDCAKVRGWLRDFADNDLDPTAAKRVEEHAHRCRTCAVELARAEHEVLRVRSALTKGAALSPLPADFAARVVERLVLDETSMVSGETLRRPVEKGAVGKGAVEGEQSAAGKGAADGGPAASGGATGEGAGRKPFVQLHPALMLVGAMLMLWGLAFGVETFGVRSTVPKQEARLVVIASEGVVGRDGLLGPGSGLGDNESLHAGPHGWGDVELHDSGPGPQPAATIRVHADGELGLENGRPRIYGHVDLETNRLVSLPMADGSELVLGRGEYSVTATLNPGEDPLAATPKDLLVEVQVKRGEATINRSGLPATLVAAGLIGIYQGRSDATFTSIGGGIAVGTQNREPEPMLVPAVPASYLIGHVRDYTGAATQGSYAWLAYSVSGTVRNTGQFAAVDGRLQLELPGKVDNGFAVVKAVAPNWRPDLGMLAPDAVRLQGQGPNEVLTAPLVFETARPFVGSVRDEIGKQLQGVRVVPCVVDELFGKVWPLPGADVFSDDSGTFRCAQLPARLPPHQSLCLLLLCEGLAPTTVAIPERGSDLALVEFPPITMRLVQFVGLHHLVPSMPIDVFEEIPGLPGGTALVRRPAMSDSSGAVASLAVGFGRLWVRESTPTGPSLRRLALDQYTWIQQYRPNGDPVAWHDQFQPMQTIPGTTVQIANSHRFGDFVSGRSETGNWTPVGPFINPIGLPVVAQVFSVQASGERGCSVRFLGFSTANGMLSLPVGESGRNLVAIASDGSCAMALRGPVTGGTATIEVVPTGRAMLHPSLRPGPGGPELVPVRFRWNGEPLPGLAPEAIRFAGQATGWEMRGLLPGDYRVTVNNVGPEYPVVIPATGGWVYIH